MKQIQYTIYLLLLFWMGGCTVETDRFTDDPLREGEQVAITLRMPVESATTRALDEEDENRVNQVDILVFRPFDGQFVEVVSTDDIETDDVYNNLKTFWVRLRGETVLDLVVLGNSRDILREAFPDDEDMKGMQKDEILSELILTYEGSWVNAQGKAIRNFPMWGFRNGANVKEDDFTGEYAIRMTRMVVRVDIHVGDGARDDFKLKEVYLYNSYPKGKLAHSMTTGWDVAEHKATEPDLPQGVQRKSWKEGRIDYVDSPSPVTTAGVSSERVVYTLEAPAGDENALLETTALVVGGQYKDEVGVNYYYRVDFTETDQNGKTQFIPLVRNHNYEIQIQRVNAKGYDNPDDAFRHGMTNMELDIVAWNEANMGNITFGAQYQLVVSTDSIYFYRNGREQTLTIYTDHPSGWSIERTEKAPGYLDWLDIKRLSGNAGQSIGVGIEAMEITDPDNIEFRKDTIYIRAGGMRKGIVICQSNLEELYLEVSPSTLIFNQNGLAVKNVTVEVAPSTLPVYVSEAGTVTWSAGGFPESGLVGETTYSFQPAENTIGDQLFSTVTFSISDGTGRTTTREVLVIQNRDNSNFNITFEHDKYPSAGGNGFYMDVYSEYEWEVDEANISPLGILTPVTTGVQPAGTTRYYFNLTENPLYADRIIHLPVISSHIDFDPLTIRIIQEYDKPWLRIGSPPDLTVDFGTVLDWQAAMKAHSVAFDLNTQWEFTTSGDYDRVVGSADYHPAQTYPGGTANHPGNQTVVFTPFVYKAEEGTPAENTVVTGSATFTTADHWPAEAASQTVNFRITVPSLLDANSVKVRVMDDSWSPPGVILQEGEVLDVLKMYSTGTGGGFSFYTEIASNVLWSTRVTGTKTNPSPTFPAQRIHAASDWGVHRESLFFPINTDWEEETNGPKDVTFYYTYNDLEREIISVKVRGYRLDSITPDDDLLSGVITGRGRSYTFSLVGRLPAKSFMIRRKWSGQVVDYTETLSMDRSKEISITIPSNLTGSVIEDYTIQYTYDGLKNEGERRWNDLVIVKQLRGNPVLSTGVSLALNSFIIPGEGLTWAESMGIDTKYDSEPFDGVDADGNYTATENTGCNAYSEGPYGPGQWRLPTAEEALEIEEYFNRSDDRIVTWTSTSNAADNRQAYIQVVMNDNSTPGLVNEQVSRLKTLRASPSGINPNYPNVVYGTYPRCVTRGKYLDTDG